MSPDHKNETSMPAGTGDFETTHWSVVLAAGRSSSPDSSQALSELCRTYWYPLYAYVRRRVDDVHDAQDLTQEFFARFLEDEFLKDVDRQRGKFRSFLLAAMRHFLSKQRDRARAHKRGGRRVFISLDLQAAESRYKLEPTGGLTPERLFQRRWALVGDRRPRRAPRRAIVENLGFQPAAVYLSK